MLALCLAEKSGNSTTSTTSCDVEVSNFGASQSTTMIVGLVITFVMVIYARYFLSYNHGGSIPTPFCLEGGVLSQAFRLIRTSNSAGKFTDNFGSIFRKVLIFLTITNFSWLQQQFIYEICEMLNLQFFLIFIFSLKTSRSSDKFTTNSTSSTAPSKIQLQSLFTIEFSLRFSPSDACERVD